MHNIEQDPDGYTSRSIIDMLNDPPAPEITEVRYTNIDRALIAKYGPGAIWPPAAPTSMKGAAPFWIARWDAMWEDLSKAGHTYKQQMDRFRKMTDCTRGLRDNVQPDAQAVALFRQLEVAARIPAVPGAPKLPLWAVTSEVGLLLVHAPVSEMESLVDTRQAASLRQIPSGAMVLVRLDVGIQIPDDQASYWSWAAGKEGFLFGLGMAEASEPQGSKTTLLQHGIGGKA